MDNFIDLPIPISTLTKAVDGIMEKRGYVPSENIDGKTIKIKEFAKKYCGGKAMPWVRLFIFDEFPEVDFNNGGWVVNPRKSEEGTTTLIFEKPAAEWMDKHRNEIDWNAKLP